MTTPSQQEFYQMLMTVQDGTASQQQLDRWEQLIIDSPQARHWYFQFQCQAVALTDYHRQRVFLNETADESSASKDAPMHFPKQDDDGTGAQPPAVPQSRHFHASRWLLWIGSVAAMLLASIYLLTNHPWEKPIPGGSLSYVEQAVWNGVGPERNQLQKNHIYRLKSGSIRANLVGGGIASLAAPAEFRIVDDSTIELTQGKLIGRLPNPDSSLRIYCQNLQKQSLKS